MAECLLKLLKPFFNATRMLSGKSYPTLMLACPILKYVKNEINRPHLFNNIFTQYGKLGFNDEPTLEFVEAARTFLDNAFCCHFSSLLPQVKSAALLHPGLFISTGLEAANCQVCTDFLVSEMMQLHQENASTSTDSNTEDLTSVTTTQAQELEVLEGSGSGSLDGNAFFFDGLFGESDENNNTQSVLAANYDETHLKLQCITELNKYFKKMKTEPSSTRHPLAWWRKHRATYPLLAQVACKWLGCTCSSVPSERAFSTGSNTVTNKRASLGKDNVRDIIFLHDNWKNIKFEN